MIFKEWSKLKKRYQKILIKKKKYDSQYYEKYSAEEEIVIGLIFFLNEKIINQVKCIIR